MLTATNKVLENPISSTEKSEMMAPPKYHLAMFEIGKPLGKGKFGAVSLARHRKFGFICALKVLNKDQIMREGSERHVRREIEIHSNLYHVGVLRFIFRFLCRSGCSFNRQCDSVAVL
jgi:aurora kinase, other